MTHRCILAPLASPDTLRGQVTDADWAAAARRRAEYLTWRAVVYRELGAVPIGYDAAGGPVLIGDPRHIGVSHGGGHAAVVISDRPCAVDIESETRRFTRAAAHFLTPAEAALGDDPRVAGVVWCAKETLYKLARRATSRSNGSTSRRARSSAASAAANRSRCGWNCAKG